MGAVTLTQYLRVLRQRWLIVTLLAVLGLGAAAAYTSQQTPVYAAQTQLFISVRSRTSDLSQLSEGSTFSQQRVKSYADIVASPLIAQVVIADLRLPYTPAQLTSEISASTPLDTVLLDVVVSDTDPTRAAAIANAVAAEFPQMIAHLENPTDRVVSPVKVTTTRRAEVPGAPVSPRIPLNLALGLLVGLGLGIGTAVLRDQFNTAVSGVNDLERLTGAIPLGVVPFDATAAEQPLVTANQFGGRAEAFRTLRTNLRFADVDDPPRVIAVTSPLPAEGKTTTACNLALTLAQSGARVVLVEGDLRKPSVGTYLGISNAAGLTNVLAGQHELRDVIIGYQRDTLAVLPSGPTPPNPSELLGSQHMRQLIASLANHYDMVIIDAPPLLPVTDAAVLAAAADGAILVVRHGKSQREQVQRALQALTSVNAKVLGTLLNFAPSRKRRGGYDGYGYGYGYGHRVSAGSPAADSLPVNSQAPPPMVTKQPRRSRRRPRQDAPIAVQVPSPPLPPIGSPVTQSPPVRTPDPAPAAGWEPLIPSEWAERAERVPQRAERGEGTPQRAWAPSPPPGTSVGVGQAPLLLDITTDGRERFQEVRPGDGADLRQSPPPGPGAGAAASSQKSPPTAGTGVPRHHRTRRSL